MKSPPRSSHKLTASKDSHRHTKQVSRLVKPPRQHASKSGSTPEGGAGGSSESGSPWQLAGVKAALGPGNKLAPLPNSPTAASPRTHVGFRPLKPAHARPGADLGAADDPTQHAHAHAAAVAGDASASLLSPGSRQSVVSRREPVDSRTRLREDYNHADAMLAQQPPSSHVSSPSMRPAGGHSLAAHHSHASITQQRARRVDSGGRWEEGAPDPIAALMRQVTAGR